MSQFKTLALTLIFTWTSIGFARLPDTVEANEDLKADIEQVAQDIPANGMTKKQLALAAIAKFNKDRAPGQQVQVADNTEACGRPVSSDPFKAVPSKKTTAMIAGVVCVLMFGPYVATHLGPAPQPAPVIDIGATV